MEQKSYTLTNVKITHYCSCVKCCGKEKGSAGYGLCADNTEAGIGTVAADWSQIPRHSVVEFTNPKTGQRFVGIVRDKGGAIKGARLDI